MSGRSTSSSAAGAVTPIRPGADATPPAPPAPIAPADLRSAPSWLSNEAKALWRELVPKLEDAFPDAIAAIDVPALSLMLEHLAIAQAAASSMRGRGNKVAPNEVDEAHRDRLRKHPSSQIMRDHGKAFMELAREYGLTPRARRMLDLVPVAPDDEEDDDLFDT